MHCVFKLGRAAGGLGPGCNGNRVDVEVKSERSLGGAPRPTTRRVETTWAPQSHASTPSSGPDPFFSCSWTNTAAAAFDC